MSVESANVVLMSKIELDSHSTTEAYPQPSVCFRSLSKVGQAGLELEICLPQSPELASWNGKAGCANACCCICVRALAWKTEVLSKMLLFLPSSFSSSIAWACVRAATQGGDASCTQAPTFANLPLPPIFILNPNS